MPAKFQGFYRIIQFVTSEIIKNDGIAICAPIAPYAATHRTVRDETEIKDQADYVPLKLEQMGLVAR